MERRHWSKVAIDWNINIDNDVEVVVVDNEVEELAGGIIIDNGSEINMDLFKTIKQHSLRNYREC